MTLFYRRSVRGQVSAAEKGVMAALLSVLLGVGGWVAWRGGQVDPDLFRLREDSLKSTATARTTWQREKQRFVSTPKVQGSAARAALVEDLLGADFRRDGAVETFGPDNLYEKIDGREGLYKAYNFRGLACASYQSITDKDLRVDVEIFEHATATDVLGVLSAERAGGTAVGGERTELPNGLYVAMGTHYVRFVASAAVPGIRMITDDAAGRIAVVLAPARADPGAAGAAPSQVVRPGGPSTPRKSLDGLLAAPQNWSAAQHPLFALGARTGTLQVQQENGLGMAFFRGVHLATFVEGKTSVQGYVLAAGSAEEADGLLQKYAAHLATQGSPVGTARWQAGKAVAVTVALLNTVETATTAGRFVVGVTEAPDVKSAEITTRRLHRAFSGAD